MTVIQSAPVAVLTLGPLEIRRAGEELVGYSSQRKLCAVLIYLADQRRARRDVLCGMFWPDREPERAKHLLSQMIYGLKRALGEGVLDSVGDEIVATESLSCDTVEFEAAVNTNDPAGLALYRGSFLADFSLPASNEIETWVDRRRAALARSHRKLRRSGLQLLIDAGDLDGALAMARAWVDLDPFEDEAHHRVIELSHLTGARSAAIIHFEEYTRRLQEELDVKPLDETSALVDRIRNEPTTREVSDIPGRRRTVKGIVWQSARSAKLSGLVVLTIFIVGIVLGLRRNREDAPSKSAQFERTRIAVLYFEDHTQGATMSYLAKGLTESLISELSQVDALNVVSRHGVKTFAERSAPLDSIVSTLEVGTIIEGSVQGSGDSVRVTVNMVDAPTKRRVAGVTIKKRMTELFALQDEVSRDVAGFLRQRLGREVQLGTAASRTQSLEAWRLFQEADATRERLLDTRAFSDPLQMGSANSELVRADNSLGEAIRLDPKWVEPVVLRGWIALDRATIHGYVDTAAFNSAARAGLDYAERALERRPGDAAALELRGVIYRQLALANPTGPNYLQWHKGAEADMRMALQKDPRRASAWAALSRLLQYDGKFDEAKLYARRALSEDAFLRDAASIHQRLYKLATDNGDPQSAREWCHDGHRQFPADVRFVECQLAIPAWYNDQPIKRDSAERLLERMRVLDPAVSTRRPHYSSVYRQTLYAAVIARNGERERAQHVLDSLRAVVQQSESLKLPFGFDEAHVLLELGDTTQAARVLERYMTENPQYRSFVEAFPPYSRLTATSMRPQRRSTMPQQ